MAGETPSVLDVLRSYVVRDCLVLRLPSSPRTRLVRCQLAGAILSAFLAPHGRRSRKTGLGEPFRQLISRVRENKKRAIQFRLAAVFSSITLAS